MAKVLILQHQRHCHGGFSNQGNDGHRCYTDQIRKPFTKVDTINIPEGCPLACAASITPPSNSDKTFGLGGQNGKTAKDSGTRAAVGPMVFFVRASRSRINKGQQDNERNGAEQGSNLIQNLENDSISDDTTWTGQD